MLYTPLAIWGSELRNLGSILNTMCSVSHLLLDTVYSMKSSMYYITFTFYVHPVARRSPMLGEDHFARSWVWAGYIYDSGYFQFQPFLIGYFGEIAFFVFLHYKINGSKGVFWP